MSRNREKKAEADSGGSEHQAIIGHVMQPDQRQEHTVGTTDDQARSGTITFRSSSRGKRSVYSYWEKLIELADRIAPCTSDQWFAAAIAVIPLESVRYKSYMRAGRVHLFLNRRKEYAIVDGMFLKLTESAVQLPMSHKLWNQMKQQGHLPTDSALQVWTKNTWKKYKYYLVRIGWAQRSDTGLIWTGPETATFQEFQQKMRNKV